MRCSWTCLFAIPAHLVDVTRNVTADMVMNALAGQERATRVIRLLAHGTVEQSVLDSQKAQSHDGIESHMLAADADDSTVLRMLNAHP